jgi:MFS family permease
MYKVIAGEFTSTIGSAMFMFGLGIYILNQTGSTIQFAIAVAIPSVASCVLSPIAGVVTDRFEHKKIVTHCQMIAIAALVLFALTHSLFGKNLIIPTVLLLCITNTVSIFVGNALDSSIVTIIHEDLIPKCRGYINVGNSSSRMIAPLIGASVVALVPLWGFVLIMATTELITLAINFSIDFHDNSSVEHADLKEHNESVGPLQLFTEGLAYVWQLKRLFVICITLFLFNFMTTANIVGRPILLLQGYHATNFQYGVVNSLTLVGSIVGGLVFGRKPFKGKLLSIAFKIVTAVATLFLFQSLIFFFVKSSWLAVCFICLHSLFTGSLVVCASISYRTWMAVNIPVENQGRANSFLSIAASLPNAFGIILFGFIFGIKGVSKLTIGGFYWLIAPVVIVSLMLLAYKLLWNKEKNPIN